MFHNDKNDERMAEMTRFKVTFVKAILAGIAVSIGGAIYLSCSSKTLGAILFSFAFYLILNFDYNLYTGKVGYLVNEKLSYLKFLGIVILGNLLGTVICGLLLRYAFSNEVVDKAYNLVLNKLEPNIIRVFINSFFCGILMFIGADFFKKKEDNFIRTITVFLVVIIFILAKFEHSVANMFYFTVGWVWNFKSIYYLIIMVFGNAIGSITFCALNNVVSK